MILLINPITVHRTIKMKPMDVKDNTYFDSKKEVSDKDPKFKVGDHVRISKYKNIFGKGYTPNWSEEVFIISKIENTVPWRYVINDFNGEEVINVNVKYLIPLLYLLSDCISAKSTPQIGTSNYRKTNQKEFRIEKVIKKRVLIVCQMETL